MREDGMRKNKFIGMILACLATILIPSKSSAIFTMDSGNISGTIGIVSNGANGIMQSMEIITNGSLLNSVLGDAAGTLSKFKEKFGGDVEKALKAAEDAKKRVEEGTAAYNKYKNEIETRKAKYQELLDQLDVANNEEVYEDDFEEVDYPSEYDNPDSSDNSPENNESQTINNTTSSPQSIAVQPSVERAVPTVPEIQKIEHQPELNTPTPAVIRRPLNPAIGRETLIEAEKIATEIETDLSDKKIIDKELPSLKNGTSVAKPALKDAIPVDSLERKVVAPIEIDSSPAVIRKPFIPSLEEQELTDKVINKSEEIKTDSINDNTVIKEVTSPLSPLNDTETTVTPKETAPVIENIKQPGTIQETPKLRIPPNTVIREDRISSSELHFTSRQIFADEISDVKGVNYDSKGTFITPLAKRCDMSVKDLLEPDKMKACLTQIVSENNARDQNDAITSLDQCNVMVYDTVVAVLAEATNAKYEASNYSDTLDKQEELASTGSSTIRDDTGVIAMNNEQTEILLNKMSMLLSGNIILDSVQRLCSTSKDVLTDSQKSQNYNGSEQ